MNIKQENLDIHLLEVQLKNEPNNTDVMNELAIAYLNATSMPEVSEKIDELLEKAYRLNPSLKTANNYAYLLIKNDFGYKEGIEVLSPFMARNPNTFVPYKLMGYAYLNTKQFELAEENLEKALSLSPQCLYEILHNLAVSKSMLNKYNEALPLYAKSIALHNSSSELTGEENISLYNKGVCLLELNTPGNIDIIIDEIRKTNAYKFHDFPSVSNIDLARLAYLASNTQLSYELLIENCNIYLSDYPEFAYLLSLYNKCLLNELREEEICNRHLLIKDCLEEVECESNTSLEREELIFEYKKRIKMLKNEHYHIAPKIKAKNLYKIAHYGCELLGCTKHRCEMYF